MYIFSAERNEYCSTRLRFKLVLNNMQIIFSLITKNFFVHSNMYCGGKITRGTVKDDSDVKSVMALYSQV